MTTTERARSSEAPRAWSLPAGRAACSALIGLLAGGERTAAARRDSGPPGTILVEDRAGPGLHRVTLGAGDPVVRVQVHDPRAYTAVLLRSSMGLAESYLAGWWETDELTEVVRVAFRLSAGMRRRLDATGRRAGRLLAGVQRLRPPSEAADRRNVAAHYDLSNDLFALMLDPAMVYSCATFDHPAMTLEAAQMSKMDRLATKLGLGPSDHVVEIGGGWGGLAVHLAQRYGCRVTTTTISESQQHFAAKRVAEQGVSDRVSVLGLDYRELTGTYDALLSIEMIEAVDWRRHDEFFATCRRLLAPGGRMGLQAITIADVSYERAKLHGDFVRTMIFPGGCLPSVAALSAAVARATDLQIVDLEDIGAHYPETLRRWRANLSGRWQDAARLGFDERFQRLFELYLCYCEAAFLEGQVSDVQVVLRRPGSPRPAP